MDKAKQMRNQQRQQRRGIKTKEREKQNVTTKNSLFKRKGKLWTEWFKQILEQQKKR